MFKQLRPALASLLVLSMVTGVAYPLLVTGIAQLAFPEQANGSLLRDAEGKVLGSRLIAQKFNGEEWFHSRPSAGDYATVSSAASNLAPSNPALAERIARTPPRSVSPTRGRCRWRWSLPPVADSIRSCRRRPRVTRRCGWPRRAAAAAAGGRPGGKPHRAAAGGAGGGQRAGAEHGAGGVEALGFPRDPRKGLQYRRIGG